jgi:hypothetical protein
VYGTPGFNPGAQTGVLLWAGKALSADATVTLDLYKETAEGGRLRGTLPGCAIKLTSAEVVVLAQPSELNSESVKIQNQSSNPITNFKLLWSAE